ncbi:hypothetical protein R6Q59_000056 [Mikania micrantha]
MQEPHMEVKSPVSQGVQMYNCNMNRLLVFMYLEFRACQKCGLVPAICANQLSVQFANVAEVSLGKRLKMFCDFQGFYEAKFPEMTFFIETNVGTRLTPANRCWVKMAYQFSEQVEANAREELGAVG